MKYLFLVLGFVVVVVVVVLLLLLVHVLIVVVVVVLLLLLLLSLHFKPRTIYHFSNSFKASNDCLNEHSHGILIVDKITLTEGNLKIINYYSPKWR